MTATSTENETSAPPARAASPRRGPRPDARARLRTYAPVVAAFLLATWLTDAWFMGDTSVYAGAILNYERGLPPTSEFPFWEFGHLVWRPAGWLAYRATRPLTALAVGDYPTAQVTVALLVLNWIAGLAAAVAFRALLARFGARAWAANVAAVAFVFANAFLDYAQTGCAYVPGLAFFLVGLYFLAPRDAGDATASLDDDAAASRDDDAAASRDFDATTSRGDDATVSRGDDAAPRGDFGAAGSRRDAVCAGASLAASVCVWFPFVLVAPGALALPLLLGRGPVRGRLRFAFESAVVAGVLTAAAYLGYRRSGLPRLAFGFARSFIHMGQDGLMFKRYLLRDPFSPVSLADLFRLSLWKLGLFYLSLAAAGAALAGTPRGRRVLAWALTQIVPVFLFALLLFESGMPERYLPLYPAVFAAFALALSTGRARGARWLLPRAPVLAFAAAVVVSNFAAMRAGALSAEQGKVFARIGGLHPRLTPESLVVVVHLQDEVSGFYHNFPLHPLNRRGTLRIYSVTEPGSERILTWRQDFADKVLAYWGRGGDVWLSKRLFTGRPRPDWNWAEGDDARISWTHLRPFFSQIETGAQAGGEDGFALLTRGGRNEEFLRRVSQEPRAADHRSDLR
ncbi:MAG: hypothetical protein LC800_15135 [Acidobacteria bacterium]|nr:hypothetical protein [Acidobacteriota bacterium]